MNISITLNKINYASIAKKAMPIISAKVDSMEEGIGKRMLQKAISEGAAEKALALMPQKLKEQIVIKLFENNRPEILLFISDFLSKKNIPIVINDLHISEENGMILIRAETGAIDYENIAEQMFPVALEKLKSYDGDNILIRTIGKMQDVPEGLAGTILSTLPAEAKDELALYFINGYKSEITSAVNRFMRSKGIEISFVDVSIY